ncbi:MAG: type II toxin-antitoxin system HicB family antitoxin [Nitrospiraceae bacterium]|nr:type II toxin-antitoxin system HicB family antitoxin [Nitrospiraceae bacterium]
MKKIKRTQSPYPFEAYAHVVSPLSDEEGGGFLITFPDLPGCMSDGATIEEAIKNGREAFHSWMSAWIDSERPVPQPAFSAEDAAAEEASGRFITRVPKSVHLRLTAKARAEGVSLNTLVVSLLSEGLGRKKAHSR